VSRSTPFHSRGVLWLNSDRPNHFIELKSVLGSSSVHDIYIENYPVHCFSISNSAGVDIHHITLNNSAGYAPNDRSNGLAAAHNSDGRSQFDVGESSTDRYV
jgi:polygalacturonase